MPTVERVYLVIGADRKVRAAKRPQIRGDEVAIAINLTYPETWGRVVSSLDITVPDFAPTEAERAAAGDVS
jgi:hypothetical protein